MVRVRPYCINIRYTVPLAVSKCVNGTICGHAVIFCGEISGKNDGSRSRRNFFRNKYSLFNILWAYK